MPEPINREEAIFQAATELETAEERAEFVQKACGNDPDLHQRVSSLLRAHDGAGTFLNSPAVVRPLAAGPEPKPNAGVSGQKVSASEKSGDRIGRYKLLQQIGEGGCGVVYMAEQEEPVRRRVALKIIKVGMDTRQVIARFEAERQALAMMDHPNIARVLDAGATEAGRPFFVMDLVRGIRITEYCDQGKLSTEERIRLFIQVCHAIQHAHQKGIIHRDIKPSNILVTLHDGVPVPVIIDFGIAKATEQRLTDKTLFTAFEQFIGTPAYMSPEQAEMSRLDIDTRSDIYSLGVLLYELLTGRTPFDPKALVQSGLEEMRRTIRDKEPVRPSTCLSTMLEGDLTTVAKDRHSEPLRLIHLLRGDLDWIVMKCLEKDRTRRYETANGLAMDLERHLHHEPVLARPPSRIYRIQKLVRRNKVTVAAAVGIAAALVLGLALSTHLFFLERKAHRRAVAAEKNETRLRLQAEDANAREKTQRELAEANAYQSRLNSYAADVHSAFIALQAGNLGRAVDLLEHQYPGRGEEDLRGFEWRYLWQQAQGDELLSLPHDALVSSALFTANGQQLVTASYDGLLRVWDYTSRRVLRTLSGFEQTFGWHYVALSPDGRWLAGMRQGKLTVWDGSDPGYPVRFEEESPARVLAFTPDNRRLVGWGGSSLTIVDLDRWEIEVLPTQLRHGSFPALAVEPGGNRLALAHEGEWAIEIWNLQSRSRENLLTFAKSPPMAFVALAWSSSLLAATTWSGRLLLIDPESGREIASTNAHRGSVFGLAFNSDGNTLVTAGHDQLIHFWTVPSLERVNTLRGHRDEIWSLAFSNDGRLFCTAGKDGTAKIWSPGHKPPLTILANVPEAVFSADGRHVISVSKQGPELALKFWEVSNPGVHTTKTLPLTDPANIGAIRFSPGAKLLGIERIGGAVEVWNAENGKLIQSRNITNSVLTAGAFTRSGRLLAIGMASGLIEVWNIRTGQVTSYASPEGGAISMLEFSPGGHFLIAHSQEKRHLQIWELASGARLSMPPGNWERVAISPDGRTLVASDLNHSIYVWGMPEMTQRFVLKGHRWTIYSLAFSPDSRVLATGGGDAVVRLWDMDSGRELSRPLRGHLQGVTELAFSPDGKALATGSTDGTVKIWHVATGRELFSAAEAELPVFAPDGSTLMVRTRSGLKLFHAPTLAQIDAVRAEAVEREQH